MNSFQLLKKKDPHRLHTRLEQTSSESHLQNSTWYETLGPTRFFNDDFGRLMRIDPLFRVVRVAVLDPFFMTYDKSPDKSIINGIINKLKADIHSRCACWGVKSRGTDLQLLYDFPSLLVCWSMVSFYAPSSPGSLWVLFAYFLPNFCVYSQYPIIYIFQNS